MTSTPSSLDALEPLEGLYERYRARLIHRTDGCFFLVPSGDRLSRRQLTPGEMLVGQALALLYQGPATLERTGVVDRSAALERLIRGGEVVPRSPSARRSTGAGERTTLCGSRAAPLWPLALAHKAEARP